MDQKVRFYDVDRYQNVPVTEVLVRSNTDRVLGNLLEYLMETGKLNEAEVLSIIDPGGYFRVLDQQEMDELSGRDG